MNEPASGARKNVLLFSAVAEVTTGLVLMFDPAIVVRLLFGVETPGVAPLLARCFGVAVLALGLAPALKALLLYNAFIALYLAYLGSSGQATGPLLWPVVAVHAAIPLLLTWTGRRTKAAAS